MTRTTPPTADPSTPEPPASTRSATVMLIIGGLLMTILFVPFTVTHGPTSFNEERIVLGRDMRLWGMLLGVVPSVLIGIGFWRLRRRLAGTLLLPWVACTTISLALWASALLDLLFQALGPPLGILVLAPAMVAAAATSKPLDPTGRRARVIMGVLGAVLMAAMIMIFLPGDATDAYDGYRIFGITAYAVPGLLWAALGFTLRTED